jgi:hypothetical protein
MKSQTCSMVRQGPHISMPLGRHARWGVLREMEARYPARFGGAG